MEEAEEESVIGNSHTMNNRRVKIVLMKLLNILHYKFNIEQRYLLLVHVRIKICIYQIRVSEIIEHLVAIYYFVLNNTIRECAQFTTIIFIKEYHRRPQIFF